MSHAFDFATRNHAGQTPFHVACSSNNIAAVRVMIGDTRVDIEAPNTNGCTPMWVAANEGHAGIVDVLLTNGANPGRLCSGLSTLHYITCLRGDAGILKLLIKRHVDLDSAVLVGTTASDLKSQQRNMRVIRLLLRHGANPEATDVLGRTALHMASELGNLPLVKLLLCRYHANARANTTDGRTPADCATQNKHAHVLDFLMTLLDVAG